MSDKNDDSELNRRKRLGVPILAAGIGTRIREIADAVGGAQRLADLLALHVTQIYRYQKGENEPPIGVIVRLAHISGRSIGWIATGEEGGFSVQEDPKVYGNKSRPRVDTNALVGVITAIESHAAGLPVETRAELIANAYTYRIATGRLDDEYIQSLLRIAKQHGR